MSFNFKKPVFARGRRWRANTALHIQWPQGLSSPGSKHPVHSLWTGVPREVILASDFMMFHKITCFTALASQTDMGNVTKS